MGKYFELDVWRQAMLLAEESYRITRAFPADERFGLTSEIRRAATSIPSNVAEGHCRRTTGAFMNHVSIGLGSHGELDTRVELSARFEYVSRSELARFVDLSGNVGRMLNGLYNSLKAGR
jgi:four helix bundle protein